MLERLEIGMASDAGGWLPGPTGLRLEESFQSFVSAHGAEKALNGILPFGQYRRTSSGIRLRLWPDKLWLEGQQDSHNLRIVDISHGLVHFRLRGIEALHMIADYSTVDLFAPPVRKSQAARTSINGHDCVVYWDSTRDVHVVLDRSLAQSFVDMIRELAVRRDPPDQSTHPRPTHPGAPERRG